MLTHSETQSPPSEVTFKPEHTYPKRLRELLRVALVGASALVITHESRPVSLPSAAKGAKISSEHFELDTPLIEPSNNPTDISEPERTPITELSQLHAKPSEIPAFIDWMVNHRQDWQKIIHTWSEKIQQLRLPTTLEIIVSDQKSGIFMVNITQKGLFFSQKKGKDNPTPISKAEFLATANSPDLYSIQIYWNGETDGKIPPIIADGFNKNREVILLGEDQFVFREVAHLGFTFYSYGGVNNPANTENGVRISPSSNLVLENILGQEKLSPLFAHILNTKPITFEQVWNSNKMHEGPVILDDKETQALHDWLRGNYYAVFGADS